MSDIEPGYIKLPRDVVQALTCGESEVDGWKVLENEVVGEWRWGNRYRLVVQKQGILGIWAYRYKEQSGDEYWNSVEDEGDEVEFYFVQPRLKTVVEYVTPEGEL